jgi:hypothetical protein
MGKLGEARDILDRLRFFSPNIVPHLTNFRLAEDRELLLAGLRLAEAGKGNSDDYHQSC